jgi:hypothetical protein
LSALILSFRGDALKSHLPAAGLTFFPKSDHVLNLEEPALFNEMVERFIALVEAGRWGRPRSKVDCWINAVVSGDHPLPLSAPLKRADEGPECLLFGVDPKGGDRWPK